MHRATPLVRAVVGLMGTGDSPGTVVEAKTRVMMLARDRSGGVPAGGMADPPKDLDRQRLLLKAAMERLPFESRVEGGPKPPASARGPNAHRRRELKLQTPLSARTPAHPAEDVGATAQTAMGSSAMASSAAGWTGAGAQARGGSDGSGTPSGSSPKGKPAP